MSKAYLNNFSYLFVPLTTDNIDQFPAFYKNINATTGWDPIDVENRYLHRYVSERITAHAAQKTAGYHFRLNENFAKEQGLHLGTKCYSTDAKVYQGQKDTYFRFRIANVELFSFNTGICILAFELQFEEDDPIMIASAQYYLRKITTERIHIDGDTGADSRVSFVDISRRILSKAAQNVEIDFFFYAAPNNEKANFLTYVDVPCKEAYERELFHLKWCYHDGFDYRDEADFNDSENYVASRNTIWGITVSAAVCLVNRDEKQREFIENVFQKNFRRQYLMTYVLLLHQKYMMYLFLTKMSVGIDGDLEQLEKYKAKLYDFETNYMFTYISEVPQYQRFYTKVRNQFALEDLFRGVQEPLSQLTEIQKQTAENKQREYDYRINTALTTLSLLTIVSALTDATGVTSNLTWLIAPQISRIIQIIMLVLVSVVSIFMLARLISLKKKR